MLETEVIKDKLEIGNILSVAQEIISSGQLWITIRGEEFYVPELISDLQTIVEKTND